MGKKKKDMTIEERRQKHRNSLWMRFVRWVEMGLAPKPGAVIKIAPGNWDPEASMGRDTLTLHERKPDWFRLDSRYKSWKKTDLPTHWVVVEKIWDWDSEKVFVRIVSMGEKEVTGWCQYLHYQFDDVDMKKEEKRSAPVPKERV